MSAEQLFEKLEDENQNIQYAINKIFAGEYQILPDSIAYGKVLKIHYKGDLNSQEGFELGFLILTPNSGIKKHKHINDIEKYQVIYGTLSIEGINSLENVCLIEEEHCIDKVTQLTIIKTIKINKKLLNEKQKTLSN